ncbi:DEAD/DEAH box helicase [Rummeliibacillus stabekisii]|uniref:DEAD/DEAH box helicase n=1 Tax=Rummeliibacillus stabekisii TaxID=241244 RepID=UPI000A046448|nr:type ISP restriction/modification enzyme [Rummeliibacillus stabekisii]
MSEEITNYQVSTDLEKTFDKLINQINESAGSVQRDRGTYFEKLVEVYLQNEPVYKNLYSDVWLLHEVPAEYGISKKDTGVDLVARNKNTGELTAIQAQFYSGKVGKAEINSFIAELGKDYYSSGMIVSTTDEWNQNALTTVQEQTKQVQLIGLSDLLHSKIDWSSVNFEKPKEIIVKSHKGLRDYQKQAIEKAKEYFTTHDRGMLVMAPGTGKTFTSLKMVEQFAKDSGQKVYNVLYLVPSIQLLTQTLFSWNSDVLDDFELNSFAVTSDRKATKKKANDDDADIQATDIGFPATTRATDVVKNYESLPETSDKIRLNVVFSTYQSIDVMHEAQENGFPEFDFIISDEAHRTTGFHEQNQEESPFAKVHSNKNVKGKLRLYQTATPKIYSDDAKSKGIEKSVVIASMDDESIFGTEIFRLGFGEAVARGYLTDYKVMVLTVEEEAMTKNLQQTLADPENGLNIDDVGRIVGVWNAMIKREGATGKVSGTPMKRAISFIDTIKNSEKIAEKFNAVVNEYLGDNAEDSFHIEVKHVDGTLNALQKKDAIDWLAGDIDIDEARVLSNVKFLTEGIDVPNLDAVIFFSPKKSQVDIVQAVGRIMRKFEGKEYGYIILPIVIPAGVTPENVLDDNKTYAAVWQVLNALRSTDERFNAIVNQLQLNNKKPENINIINPGKGRPRKPYSETDSSNGVDVDTPQQMELELWDNIEDAIFGRIVQKVGDRRYLEDWSKDVNEIAQRYIRWINERLEDEDNPIKKEFDKFISSLRHNINESITQESAVEMLAQHLITKPVFEALFDEYSFVNNNPISSAMESIVAELQKAGFEKEQEKLEPFYESVKLRASGIDNAAGKQKIIVTLYDKFFSTGFKSTTERLGIVFTPVEVVDFIVHSVDDVLKKHFGKSLADEGVNILDPFTGTGTFIVRTLTYLKQQMDNGEITLADITRKYMQELHANEIVLLSYYIAAINIEATFDEINGKEGYVPFEGIVLTDTFESTENEDTLNDEYFGTNDERLKRQQELPITAIIGNPPYSAKQENEDGNQARITYPILDDSLRRMWSDTSTATNKSNLFDSYIRAIRWSANRIQTSGVIGFITNNSFLDGNAMDGMRKSLVEEFSDIYIIDLKGKIRGLSKEQVKNEGGNIFDIMTGVAISIFVKDKEHQGNGRLHYYNIGDRLSKKDKLEKVVQIDSINNITSFDEIIPNRKGDWLNQRNSNFDELIKLGDKKSDDSLFIDYTGGIKTGRDSWAVNFSLNAITKNMMRSIEYYMGNIGNTDIYNSSTNELSWTASLKQKFERKEELNFKANRVYTGMYRPFTKKYVYYDSSWVDRQYQMPKIMPDSNTQNLLISLSNKTGGRIFSSLIVNVLPDVNLFAGGSQNLPKYLYDNMGEYSAIRTEVLSRIHGLSEDEVLYYIYGIFHSKEYKKMYFEDLSKSFPRLPVLKNKDTYIEVGRKLADLHLNYENQSSYDGVQVNIADLNGSYRVKKMKHSKKKNEEGKSVNNLSEIIYNENIKITNIPEQAYEYVVNGRPAIEWIIDQYQVKTDKKSGITDDPNEFSDDPKYILNLLLSIINISMQTIELVNSLPPLEIIDDDKSSVDYQPLTKNDLPMVAKDTPKNDVGEDE